jgi:hypothetical protein
VELIKEIGAFAGLVAFLGLAVLALLSFAQGRDLRRLREWAGSAPERDSERKESTSADAAERAEEMRRLEQARDAERTATDLRAQRRERREAGGEGLRSRLGEPRYLAAIFAVLALIAGGVAFAVLGGSGDGGAGGKGGEGGRQVSRTIKPAEIEVTVLNGTAVDGLAGTYGDMVERRGFQLGAVTNSRSSFSESVVMFEQGNGRAAHRVADSVEISRVRPMTSEIASLSAGAPVAIVIGEDDASSAG